MTDWRKFLSWDMRLGSAEGEDTRETVSNDTRICPEKTEEGEQLKSLFYSPKYFKPGLGLFCRHGHQFIDKIVPEKARETEQRS